MTSRQSLRTHNSMLKAILSINMVNGMNMKSPRHARAYVCALTMYRANFLLPIPPRWLISRKSFEYVTSARFVESYNVTESRNMLSIKYTQHYEISRCAQTIKRFLWVKMRNKYNIVINKDNIVKNIFFFH